SAKGSAASRSPFHHASLALPAAYQEAHPMAPSIPRPKGPRGLPSGSPLHRDRTDFGPIPGAAADGPSRARSRIARFPMWSRGRIGLLLLTLIVLSWLPIFGPPRDPTPARRVRGVGDTTILTFAFAPHGATIATIQTDGRVALRDAAGGASDHSFL